MSGNLGKPNYSVVMAVYKNDSIEWFKESIESILSQSVATNDLVIVRDGIVPGLLEQVLIKYENRHQEVTVIRLKENIGAGQARNVGVKQAKNELVGIMDADDIAILCRFELQLAEFGRNSNLALLGGQLAEFVGSQNNIVGYRKVPMGEQDMKKFLKLRSPINHVTIMFKRTAFLKVGGYPQLNRAEDYYMVSALVAGNYRIGNLQDVLVNCRIGSENIRRRKTIRNVRENVISRWKIHKLGVTSFLDFLVSSFAQILLFMAPVVLLDIFFRKVLRSNRG